MSETKIGSMLCPNCGKLVSISAEECIHCGYKSPGLWSWTTGMRELFRRYDFAQAVTTACVMYYALSILLDPSALFQFHSILALGMPSHESLERLGMTGSLAMQQGRWWTLITAIYLHGGLLHIFFNLMWVRQLAPQVEELFGPARLVIIYTFSGVLGFLLSNYRGIPFTIGASGSIFGLMGAIVCYGRMRGGVFGTEIYRQTLQTAAILFVFGLFMPVVNNWAHGGGFIGGYLAAMLVGYSEKSSERPWVQGLTAVTLGLTALSFGMVIWQNLF